MVPLDGQIREGVGLLGSPRFEIPRIGRAGHGSSTISRPATSCAASLAAKNRYNLRTMGVFLFVRWLHLFLVTLLGLAAADSTTCSPVPMAGAVRAQRPPQHGLLRARRALPHGIPPAEAPVLLDLRPVLLVARTALEGAFRGYLQVFNGTPFKNLIWRLLGVRLGRGSSTTAAT